MIFQRIDPEKVRGMEIIWRPLYVLMDMRERWSFNRNPQDYIDISYCLDRYSLQDAPKEIR